jgi:murein peptide amidase A
MDAVKACSLDPLHFVRLFSEAAARHGFREEPLAVIDEVPLAAYTRRTPGRRPRIYVSSGVHGDEPAPPWAVLRMMEAGMFDDRAHWFICPLLNPAGYRLRTRENRQGIDLNRDYREIETLEIRAHTDWLRRQPRFDLSLCLHEDWETIGFYLYELNPDHEPSLADTMVEAARILGPIESSALIDGRESAAPGIIRPDADPLLRDRWPEAIYLRQYHGRLGYTLETPSTAPLETRIAIHHAAVGAAVERFLINRSHR